MQWCSSISDGQEESTSSNKNLGFARLLGNDHFQRDIEDERLSPDIALCLGQTGTLGELEPKPHPWLYAETARVGLGILFKRRHKVIGAEDSSAGIVSIKLAGFCCVGISGGNIEQAGVGEMCDYRINGLMAVLDIINK